jgi:glucose/arabinose dehydrogenase
MKKLSLIFTFSLIFQMGCAQDNPPMIETPTETKYSYEVIVGDLEIPWGMAFISTDELLVTEKSGTLYHVKAGQKRKIKGLPAVYVRGQGGLLDVALHPKFSENKIIYMTLGTNTEKDDKGGNTALYCATLNGTELSDVKLLYKATPNSKKGQHYGSRIVFDNEGHLYFGEPRRKSSSSDKRRWKSL